MIECLNRLRLHAIVSCDHQDRDVSDLSATCTHGRESLVTGGIDERDLAIAFCRVSGGLVGTDVLGDATCLAADDIGFANRIEESGLAMVDVTHDGDNRRTNDEVILIAFVLAELQVVRLEQLAILVLRGHDLDGVAELIAKKTQRVVIDRLSRSDHLPQANEHLDEIGRHRVDLLGEVGQARTARQANGGAATAQDAHAFHDRGLHIVEFLALGALGLTTLGRATARTTKGASSRTTSAGATATGETAARCTTGRTTR